MANREKYNGSSINVGADDAPQEKVIKGRLHRKVTVDFGDGYAYVPVEPTPTQQSSTPSLMSERLSAALNPPQEMIPADDFIHDVEADEKAEMLRLALRAHDGVGESLRAQLEQAERDEALRVEAVRREIEMRAYRAAIGMSGSMASPAQYSQAQSVAYETNDTVDHVDQADVAKPAKSRRAYKVGVGILLVTGLAAGGVAVAAPNLPGQIAAGFLPADKSEENNAPKEIMPLPSAALVDAFGDCFNENGQGEPLITLPITSQTVVEYTYVSSKKVPKILETNYTDDKGKLVQADVKPVIITANAPAAVTACVVKADRASVVSVSGDTVTVDLAKVSPQLHQGIALDQVMRGFPSKDVVTDPKKDLWPVPTIIEGVVKAGKAASPNAEKMTPEIAATLLKNFNNPANITAEVRHSQAKTAQTLIQPGGGYAEKIKSFLKEGIAAKIKAAAADLKKQGLTDIESPKVVFKNEQKNITEKNPEPPKATTFKLGETTQITGFPLEVSPEVAAKK